MEQKGNPPPNCHPGYFLGSWVGTGWMGYLFTWTGTVPFKKPIKWQQFPAFHLDAKHRNRETAGCLFFFLVKITCSLLWPIWIWIPLGIELFVEVKSWNRNTSSSHASGFGSSKCTKRLRRIYLGGRNPGSRVAGSLFFGGGCHFPDFFLYLDF